jgi:hypothetical protein
MPTVPEFLASIDSFLAAPKYVLGADSAPTWQPMRNENGLQIKLPLEIDGEQTGPFLHVGAFPNHPTLKFCLGIVFADYMVCRLDFELEAVHGNDFSAKALGLPLQVTGPHWHSWEINRQFIKAYGRPFRLHNAKPFESGTMRKFEHVLRWYCSERNIHLADSIDLPPRTRLI